MDALAALIAKRVEIQTIAEKHGTGNVRIFGSVLRGDARPDSDIDLLVDVVGPTSPWFPGSLMSDLQDLLGRRVDIVTSRSLNPLMRDSILGEARPL